MAGRQRHLVKLADVPGAHDQPAAVGLLVDLVNDLIDLVNGSAIRGAPIAPLRPVNPAEVAVLIRPLIPDGDPVLVQVFGIRVTAEEPEQSEEHTSELQSRQYL